MNAALQTSPRCYLPLENHQLPRRLRDLCCYGWCSSHHTFASIELQSNCMNTRAFPFAVLLGLILALLGFPLHAVVDVQENGGTGDGLGDVWQLKFNATGLDPFADS